MTGTEPIPVWADSLKPTLLSSNSVLLQGRDRFVVMDAGGETALLQRHLEHIRNAQPAAPIPICFAQTHTHIDHIAGLTEFGPLPDAWPYEMAAHEQSLRILHEADRAFTLADLSGRPLTSFCPEGWRQWTVRPTDVGATTPDLSIPLGDDTFLEAFCTPGHSPDSVSWRVNRALFVGDLLAATAPMVAGIAGWNRDALLASIYRLEQVLDAYDIQRVYVGHGKPLDRAAVAKAVARSRREADELSEVTPVNRRRVQKTAARADALIGELEDLFEAITHRIRHVADKLAQIQESRTADDVRAIDRSQEVNELLEAFGQFKQTAEAQGDSALGVAAKGIQTAMRISKLLDWERLDWVLDESLLRYVRTRVVNFIQRAKGLAPELDLVSTDLAGWTQTFVKRLKDQQIGACRLDDVTGGEEGFRKQLVHCLSRTPSLGTAPLALSVESGSLPARMDPIRFFDALTRVIEDQVAHGGTGFALHAGRNGDGTVLTLSTEGAGWMFREERAALWERIFAHRGAQVDLSATKSLEPLTFRFESR